MSEITLERIKNLCAEKGIAQRQLEKELNMSNGIISKWKTASPRSDALHRVADYFGVTTDYLEGRSDFMNKDHMMKSFHDKYGESIPDTVLSDGTIVEFKENGEVVTIHSTSGSVDYEYIDPETREIALLIKNSPELKTILMRLKDIPREKLKLYCELITSELP